MSAVSPASDRAFAIDAGAIGIVSLGVAFASNQLALMTLLVPIVFAARLALWWRLPIAERGPLPAEIAFLLVCTALGAFNDHSSVVRHEIYDYGVPVYFPELSTIPIWMLLFWGLILRFVATLSRWHRLGPPASPSDRVGTPGRAVDSAALRVAFLLALVAITRQLIYRFYQDPLLSWLPFAAAIGVYAWLGRPDRHDLRLAAAFLVGGPLVEVLYIQVGGLHSYHLGWLFGVPLWIALWWVLAVIIWKDLSLRLALRLR